MRRRVMMLAPQTWRVPRGPTPTRRAARWTTTCWTCSWRSRSTACASVGFQRRPSSRVGLGDATTPQVRSVYMGDGHSKTRSFRFHSTHDVDGIDRIFKKCWWPISGSRNFGHPHSVLLFHCSKDFDPSDHMQNSSVRGSVRKTCKVITRVHLCNACTANAMAENNAQAIYAYGVLSDKMINFWVMGLSLRCTQVRCFSLYFVDQWPTFHDLLY